MITRYTLVLSYHDRSGIIAAFGPYDLPEHAERAREQLAKLPLEDGVWDTVETHDWPPVLPTDQELGRFRVGTSCTDGAVDSYYVYDTGQPGNPPLPNTFKTFEGAQMFADHFNAEES